MRIDCPLCGARDLREFTYKGAADFLERPEEGDSEGMHQYLHIRENPTGRGRELWQHSSGCAAWLVVERNMSTHEIHGVELAVDVVRAGS